MPTYQYRCKDCGHDFEVVQAFTDDALTECPECKGALKKVYGNVGISFKGSGFYKNDARSGGTKKSTSGDSDSSSKSETKETKSDTKAEKTDKKKSEKASTASKTTSD